MQGWRIYFLFSLFFLAASVIAGRLFLLQIARGEYYAALAQGQHTDRQYADPWRGLIYFQDRTSQDARKLYPAAINSEVFSVIASPSTISQENVDRMAMQLAELLQKDPRELAEILRDRTSSYVVLLRGAQAELARQVEHAAFEGIYVRPERFRRYPAGDLGAHILGFWGFEGDKRKGQYGVEGYYEDILRGTGSISSNDQAPAVELALDYNIQFVAEKKLREVVERWNAEGGSIIIMNPKTGAVLALANTPSFDPNTYSTTEDLSAFLNSAVQELYEPGSVMKPLTMAAAIDAGSVEPNTTYEDTGEIKIGGFTVRNFDLLAHGTKTMTEVLELSLNTGVVFAQQKLGKEKFRSYFLNFGLDKKTTIDLPAEVPGQLGGLLTSNRDINFATASFGQGIALTPVGLLRALGALANNGTMMQPYVVSAIHYPDGKIERTEPREAGSPISAQTAAKVTAMLVSTAEHGYDKKVRVPGYTIAAKTGTAQIPNEDGSGYSDGRYHSFFGYAPAFDPVFVGLITMKNPQGINFASDSLAPVFRDIAAYILQYYQVPAQ